MTVHSLITALQQGLVETISLSQGMMKKTGDENLLAIKLNDCKRL